MERQMKLSEVYRAYKEATFPGTVGLSEVARVTEFASFLARGLKTDFMGQYQNYIGPVDQLFNRTTSDGAFETYPKLSALETVGERLASGEFPRIAFNSEAVTLVNREYGGICEIDQYLIDTDQTRKIRAIPGSAGEAAARSIHQVAYTFMNNGAAATCYDGVFIFAAAAADHPNVIGGAANTDNTNSLVAGVLTEANYEAAIQNIQLWEGIFGEQLNAYPIAIITGSTDQFTAQRLFKDETRMSTAAGLDYGHNKNIFYNKIDVVFDKMLTAASWYVKTNIKGFMNQVLTDIEVTQEPSGSGLSFDQRMWRFRIYMAYAMGCVDWREYCKGN